MKSLRKFFVFIFIGLTISLSYSQEKKAKYIFYFIGDGLASAQRQLGEYYLESINEGTKGENGFRLRMNQFPVAAIYSSHSASSLVTDSAAAGTALACGQKTNNGVIGMRPDFIPVNSIAKSAHDNGLAVGIVTTTRITHATPASFYAHNRSRDNENEIAIDLIKSDYDFFAGGGYRHFIPSGSEIGKSKRKDGRDLLQELNSLGYEIFAGEDDSQRFLDWKPQAGDVAFASFTYTHLPFELDRKQNNKTPSLSQLTSKAIELLSLDSDGFFLMVEGGRIDHACHANDPAGTVYDVLAFDKAIEEAWAFYQKYPEQTLIIVVGDHETGGIGLGFDMNYFLKLKSLSTATGALTDLVAENDPYKSGQSHTGYISKILSLMGIQKFTKIEQTKIENAMDAIDKDPDFGKGMYGYYDPVSMIISSIASERAGVQWTTFAHTGTQLPLSAAGVGAHSFGGFYDNTIIPKKMMAAAKLPF